ncbi:MAG: hypothetical protein K8U57_23090 [Planctomycetes bacterium]|nr:hypothetical protein [Planctomycetota bacterium]
MAVTYVNELFEGRTGEDTFKRHRTYVRTFEVLTDSDNDNVITVGSCPLLPRLGSAYPGDVFALCTSVRPMQDNDQPRRWIVTIGYDTELDLKMSPDEDDGLDAGDIPENPLLRPVKWKITYQQTTEVLRRSYLLDDNDNQIPGSKPVKNSAGFLFDPPPTIEVSRPLITATKNVPRLNMSYIAQTQDAVNSKPWMGLDARCVRCVGIDAESGFENGVWFWQISYTFAVKFDNWIFRILDAGTWEKGDLGSAFGHATGLRPIMDPSANPITEPVPLNGAGMRLPIGNPEIYLRFMGYRQVDFNTLVPL